MEMVAKAPRRTQKGGSKKPADPGALADGPARTPGPAVAKHSSSEGRAEESATGRYRCCACKDMVYSREELQALPWGLKALEVLEGLAAQAVVDGTRDPSHDQALLCETCFEHISTAIKGKGLVPNHIRELEVCAECHCATAVPGMERSAVAKCVGRGSGSCPTLRHCSCLPTEHPARKAMEKSSLRGASRRSSTGDGTEYVCETCEAAKLGSVSKLAPETHAAGGEGRPDAPPQLLPAPVAETGAGAPAVKRRVRENKGGKAGRGAAVRKEAPEDAGGDGGTKVASARRPKQARPKQGAAATVQDEAGAEGAGRGGKRGKGAGTRARAAGAPGPSEVVVGDVSVAVRGPGVEGAGEAKGRKRKRGAGDAAADVVAAGPGQGESTAPSGGGGAGGGPKRARTKRGAGAEVGAATEGARGEEGVSVPARGKQTRGQARSAGRGKADPSAPAAMQEAAEEVMEGACDAIWVKGEVGEGRGRVREGGGAEAVDAEGDGAVGGAADAGGGEGVGVLERAAAGAVEGAPVDGGPSQVTELRGRKARPVQVQGSTKPKPEPTRGKVKRGAKGEGGEVGVAASKPEEGVGVANEALVGGAEAGVAIGEPASIETVAPVVAAPLPQLPAGAGLGSGGQGQASRSRRQGGQGKGGQAKSARAPRPKQGKGKKGEEAPGAAGGQDGGAADGAVGLGTGMGDAGSPRGVSVPGAPLLPPLDVVAAAVGQGSLTPGAELPLAGSAGVGGPGAGVVPVMGGGREAGVMPMVEGVREAGVTPGMGGVREAGVVPVVNAPVLESAREAGSVPVIEGGRQAGSVRVVGGARGAADGAEGGPSDSADAGAVVAWLPPPPAWGTRRKRPREPWTGQQEALTGHGEEMSAEMVLATFGPEAARRFEEMRADASDPSAQTFVVRLRSTDLEARPQKRPRAGAGRGAASRVAGKAAKEAGAMVAGQGAGKAARGTGGTDAATRGTRGVGAGQEAAVAKAASKATRGARAEGVSEGAVPAKAAGKAAKGAREAATAARGVLSRAAPGAAGGAGAGARAAGDGAGAAVATQRKASAAKSGRSGSRIQGMPLPPELASSSACREAERQGTAVARGGSVRGAGGKEAVRTRNAVPAAWAAAPPGPDAEGDAWRGWVASNLALHTSWDDVERAVGLTGADAKRVKKFLTTGAFPAAEEEFNPAEHRAMLFCHDCQRLHTYACCQSCGLSLCASCLRKAFRRGDFTWDDLYTQCVVCRGLCHCKSCLLRTSPQHDPLAFSKPENVPREVRHALAEYVLQELAWNGQLEAIVRQCDEEVAMEGLTWGNGVAGAAGMGSGVANGGGGGGGGAAGVGTGLQANGHGDGAAGAHVRREGEEAPAVEDDAFAWARIGGGANGAEADGGANGVGGGVVANGAGPSGLERPGVADDEDLEWARGGVAGTSGRAEGQGPGQRGAAQGVRKAKGAGIEYCELDGTRVICDRCCTSISCVLRTCTNKSCPADFCLDCCKDLRAMGYLDAASMRHLCLFCESPMRLVSLINADEIARLRQAMARGRALLERGSQGQGAGASASAAATESLGLGPEKLLRGPPPVLRWPAGATVTWPFFEATEGAGEVRGRAEGGDGAGAQVGTEGGARADAEGGAQAGTAAGDSKEASVPGASAIASTGQAEGQGGEGAPGTSNGGASSHKQSPVPPPRAVLEEWLGGRDAREWRLASYRGVGAGPRGAGATDAAAEGRDNYLWCPSARDLGGQPGMMRPEVLARCSDLLRRGRPFVVRDVRMAMNWSTENFERATLRKGQKYDEQMTELKALDPRTWSAAEVRLQDFFAAYRGKDVKAVDAKTQQPLPPGSLLKLKDFPPQDDFSEVFPRYHQDFCERCPMPLAVRPTDGPLNFVAAMPQSRKPPDVGPKTYVALGRREERGEGDSVTKLHMDMSDAVNIMAHTHYQKGEERGRSREGPVPADDAWGHGGAVWDIFRREDSEKLAEFLRKHAAEFRHGNNAARVCGDGHPIHNQECMLTQRHREMLKEEYGVEPWTFEQYEGEAVFIPSGCAHQVRNLRSCLKVAIDFVVPETVEHALQLRADLRRLSLEPLRKWEERRVKAQSGKGARGEDLGPRPKASSRFADKLQGPAMVVYGALEALRALGGDESWGPMADKVERYGGVVKAKGVVKRQRGRCERGGWRRG